MYFSLCTGAMPWCHSASARLDRVSVYRHTIHTCRVIRTAGVVVSCKIPILTTRVRFPGSAHIFRPVKYTVHDLVDIKLWLALYFWLMSVCEYTVSIGADWFDCTTINPNITRLWYSAQHIGLSWLVEKTLIMVARGTHHSFTGYGIHPVY